MEKINRLIWLLAAAFTLLGCGADIQEASEERREVEELSQSLSGCSIWSIASGTWYSQNDSSWDSELLGNSSSDTMGDYGCVITSLAMAYHNDWGVSTTPLQLNDSAVTSGCFGAGSSLVTVSCAINSRGGPHWVSDISKSDMASAICSGNPVLVDVNSSAHKMLVYAYSGGSASLDSSYTALDPWTGLPVTLGATHGASNRWRELF